MQPLAVRGMPGLGDAVHQRALIRAWLKSGYRPIWLQTSYPDIYWDFRACGDVRCVPLGSRLRSACKSEREAQYDAERLPEDTERRRVWIKPGVLQRVGSLIKAMAEEAGVTGTADIRLPIAPAWHAEASAVLDRLGTERPLLIYRPPVVRREWPNPARNPDPLAMHELLNAVRERFCVISVADLDGERIDGPTPVADATFHAGELHYTTIAALMARRGTVVLSPPGFALCMGRAVGAWTCGVFGGFELASWWWHGTPAPDRFIVVEPMAQLAESQVWNKSCTVDKRIDTRGACERFRMFCNEAVREYDRS